MRVQDIQARNSGVYNPDGHMFNLVKHKRNRQNWKKGLMFN